LILDAANDDDLLEWYPSQVKGPVDDEVQEGKTSFFSSSFNRKPFVFLSSGFNINN
jgi:hypothetical protein